jgi:hypothetical protein
MQAVEAAPFPVNVKVKISVKGDEQECPSHTGKVPTRARSDRADGETNIPRVARDENLVLLSMVYLPTAKQ